MKKFLSFIVCMILSLFCFAGCDPSFNYIDAEETIANTVKIELVDYKNENPKLLKLKKKEKPKFDFSKATLIATLDNSQFENIINDTFTKSQNFNKNLTFLLFPLPFFIEICYNIS